MNTSRKRGDSTAWICLFMVVVIWGAIPSMLKSLTSQIDGWTANGIRYGISALIFFPYVLRHWREAPPKRNPWRDALLPSIVNILSQCTWGWSAYHNDASILNFITRTSFLFTIVLGFWFLRSERVLARQCGFWVGVAATMSGVLAMYEGGKDSGATTLTGIILLLATSAGWGLYPVWVARYMKGYSTRLAFGIVCLYTATGLIPIMFLAGDPSSLATMEYSHWLFIIVSGLLGIAFGHILMYKVIHALGPIVLAAGNSLTPFVGALIAILFLGERLNGAQWLGGIVLVAGCLLVVRAKTVSEAIDLAPH